MEKQAFHGYSKPAFLNKNEPSSLMPEFLDSLSKKEAVVFLGIPEKVFDNFFKNAGEIVSLPREKKGRYYFSKSVLQQWVDNFRWRTVTLNRDDYRQCLDFALAQHFREYVSSDFGTGRLREFGQKITNWVKGQLGEVAVKKFLSKKFGVEIELDFALHNSIVPQDIAGVKVNGIVRKPKIGVGIKSSKPKSSYLILAENEVKRENRRSEYYVFCRPDLPDDHLLRITHEKIIDEVRSQQHFDSYAKLIPDFEPIPCEIAGFCRYNDLEIVNSIPGQDFKGIRYVIQSGKMRKRPEEWKELVGKL